MAIAIFVWSATRRRSEQVATPSTYIDSKQCQACHAAIHDSYQHVAMARSFTRVQSASRIEDYDRENHFYHASSGRHYEVLRRNGHIFQRRYELTLGQTVERFPGGATCGGRLRNHARTFLHRSNNGG